MKMKKMKLLSGMLLLSIALFSCQGEGGKKETENTDTTAVSAPPQALSIPDSCKDLCTDTTCWGLIATEHEITQATFNTMISGYSTTGKTISASNIITMLNGADCSVRVICTGDSERATNDDITVSVGRPAGGIEYSIQLFRGVLLQNPTDFNFFKAKNAAGKFTIVFSVTIGASTNYYDLSEAYP